MRLIDLTGQHFGRLTVIKRVESSGKHKRGMWLCKCECGKEIIVASDKLRSGHTKSCGCFSHECIASRSKTHGMSHTRIFKLWTAMRERCSCQSLISYPNYGGRGIKVCDEWQNSFVAFLDWSIANGYSDELSIDRIDVNGNYCPENCRWVTVKVQANNKRNSRMLTLDGETHTLAEWSELTGVKQATISIRLKKGWTVERALKEPTHKCIRTQK